MLSAPLIVWLLLPILLRVLPIPYRSKAIAPHLIRVFPNTPLYLLSLPLVTLLPSLLPRISTALHLSLIAGLIASNIHKEFLLALIISMEIAVNRCASPLPRQKPLILPLRCLMRIMIISRQISLSARCLPCPLHIKWVSCSTLMTLLLSSLYLPILLPMLVGRMYVSTQAHCLSLSIRVKRCASLSRWSQILTANHTISIIQIYMKYLLVRVLRKSSSVKSTQCRAEWHGPEQLRLWAMNYALSTALINKLSISRQVPILPYLTVFFPVLLTISPYAPSVLQATLPNGRCPLQCALNAALTSLRFSPKASKPDCLNAGR